MPRRSLKIRHDENTRAKIQTSQLINRLTKHALANEDILTISQVRAIEVLLKKTLPDLAAVDAAHVAFSLPALETPGDAVRAMAAIAKAVAAGQLPVSAATEFAKILDGFGRAVESTSFDERLKKLEGCSTTLVSPS
jgi:hypothetical protein